MVTHTYSFSSPQVVKYKALVKELLDDSELLHGIARTKFSCDNESLNMIYQLFMGKVWEYNSNVISHLC